VVYAQGSVVYAQLLWFTRSYCGLRARFCGLRAVIVVYAQGAVVYVQRAVVYVQRAVVYAQLLPFKCSYCSPLAFRCSLLPNTSISDN
jgi:hypothetical protein